MDFFLPISKRAIVPIIYKPNFWATFLPFFSSIKRTGLFFTSANAMAAASPGSRLISNNLFCILSTGSSTTIQLGRS